MWNEVEGSCLYHGAREGERRRAGMNKRRQQVYRERVREGWVDRGRLRCQKIPFQSMFLWYTPSEQALPPKRPFSYEFTDGLIHKWSLPSCHPTNYFSIAPPAGEQRWTFRDILYSNTNTLILVLRSSYSSQIKREINLVQESPPLSISSVPREAKPSVAFDRQGKVLVASLWDLKTELT